MGRRIAGLILLVCCSYTRADSITSIRIYAPSGSNIYINDSLIGKIAGKGWIDFRSPMLKHSDNHEYYYDMKIVNNLGLRPKYWCRMILFTPGNKIIVNCKQEQMVDKLPDGIWEVIRAK